MLAKIQTLWNKQRGREATFSYLQTSRPDTSQDYRDASYIVIDLETTGLEPDHDEIISVGMVMIDRWRVQLCTAQHILIKSTQSVAQSAIYHGIVDAQLQTAIPLEKIMSQLLKAMQGRILIVHSAPVDVEFLDRACRKLYQIPLHIPTIDTMFLGLRRFQLEQRPLLEDALRLYQLRSLYHLPAYEGHHALNDAIATAELFLAMASHIAGNGNMPVKRLLS